MLTKLAHHIKANAIAYVALFFAIGGGGGYALAATSSTSTSGTIHGCIYKKTGELLVKSRCDRVEQAVSWSQTGNQGVSSVSAYADVASGGSGQVNAESGLTVQHTGTGTYSVTPSATVCPFPALPVVSITPQGVDQSAAQGVGQGVPDAWENGGTNGDGVVQVEVGYEGSGSFTPSDLVGFDIEIQCGARAQ